jgi:transcription elongation factor Elf1
MNKNHCPVCGYKDIVVLDEFNCTTFEICECCGNESGLEYHNFTPEVDILKLRQEWFIKNKCEWWGEKSSIPKNWNPVKQLQAVGLYPPE